MLFLLFVLLFATPEAFSQNKKRDHSPRLGLVLSGGGAKGFAHIGALKVFEEAGLQFDYISGTSMGSIFGSLYALGYHPDSMEKMVEENGKLYVAHKGGWGVGNTISVIDLSSNTVSTTIPVADVPDGIDEKDGYLYVMCSGFSSWNSEVPSTQGGLFKIDMTTNEVDSSLSFAEGIYPTHLEIENNKLYYTISGDVFAVDLSATTLPTNALLSLNGMYNIYGFEVEDGKIYMSDPKDYNSNGEIFIYTTNGAFINSYEVGIAPNGFYFND